MRSNVLFEYEIIVNSLTFLFRKKQYVQEKAVSSRSHSASYHIHVHVYFVHIYEYVYAEI